MFWLARLFQIGMGCLFFCVGFLLCGEAERWQALSVGCLFALVWCELIMSKEGYNWKG